MFNRIRAWLLAPIQILLAEILLDLGRIKTELGVGPAYVDPAVEADYHNSKSPEHCYICGQEFRTYRKYHSGLIACFGCINRKQ